jgi:hypothetical protein
MWPTIVYQAANGRRFVDDQIGMYVPAAYDTVAIGDVLDKSSGSTIVTVIKQGYTIAIDTAKDARRSWCQ